MKEGMSFLNTFDTGAALRKIKCGSVDCVLLSSSMDAKTAAAVSWAIWHPGVGSFVATTQNTVSTPLMQDVIMLFSDRAPMKNLMFEGRADNKGFCSSSLSFERQ